MKGARADPCANTKSVPSKSITTMIGKSHHFFRTFKKSQNSLRRLKPCSVGSAQNWRRMSLLASDPSPLLNQYPFPIVR